MAGEGLVIKNWGNLSLIPSSHVTADQRVPVPLLASGATHTYAPKFHKTHAYIYKDKQCNGTLWGIGKRRSQTASH